MEPTFSKTHQALQSWPSCHFDCISQHSPISFTLATLTLCFFLKFPRNTLPSGHSHCSSLISLPHFFQGSTLLFSMSPSPTMLYNMAALHLSTPFPSPAWVALHNTHHQLSCHAHPCSLVVFFTPLTLASGQWVHVLTTIVSHMPGIVLGSTQSFNKYLWNEWIFHTSSLLIVVRVLENKDLIIYVLQKGKVKLREVLLCAYSHRVYTWQPRFEPLRQTAMPKFSKGHAVKYLHCQPC